MGVNKNKFRTLLNLPIFAEKLPLNIQNSQGISAAGTN